MDYTSRVAWTACTERGISSSISDGDGLGCHELSLQCTFLFIGISPWKIGFVFKKFFYVKASSDRVSLPGPLVDSYNGGEISDIFFCRCVINLRTLTTHKTLLFFALFFFFFFFGGWVAGLVSFEGLETESCFKEICCLHEYVHACV